MRKTPRQLGINFEVRESALRAMEDGISPISPTPAPRPPRHAARIEESPRLQKLLVELLDGEEHGTIALMQRTHLCAVGSAISELRDKKNGFDVQSRCVGRGLYRYRLLWHDWHGVKCAAVKGEYIPLVDLYMKYRAAA